MEELCSQISDVIILPQKSDHHGTLMEFFENFDQNVGELRAKYILVTATSSGILKAKQKLGRTFNSNGIAFTKISKLTMCSA